MKNLDKNGYAPSIVTFDTNCCFLCGGQDEKLDRHECFGGAMREKSKRLGLWVPLCHNRCHEYGPNAVHSNRESRTYCQQAAQKRRCRNTDGAKKILSANFTKTICDL